MICDEKKPEHPGEYTARSEVTVVGDILAVAATCGPRAQVGPVTVKQGVRAFVAGFEGVSCWKGVVEKINSKENLRMMIDVRNMCCG